MKRDRSPSRRTRHPGRYTGLAPSDRVPSWRATITLAALPVLTLAAAAFPTAAAFAAAVLVGAVAGAGFHRRHPDAFDRVFGRAPSAPDDDPAGAADG